MNRQLYFAWLCLLSLGCVNHLRGTSRSALVARRCAHAMTDAGDATVSVRVEARRAVPHDEYFQLTLFAIRSGHTDSVIAHLVGDADSLPPLPSGLYRIRVRALGYQTATDSLRVGVGEAWCLTAHLADAMVLEPTF
jgi:hypothetical protein